MQKTDKNSDYLVIGHVTRDLIPDGYKLGGTVTYSALCAESIGKNPAIITSCSDDIQLNEIKHFPILVIPSENTTTFENIETSTGRKQILHSSATTLGIDDIPTKYKSTEIVHLGPVANEISPDVIDAFSNCFIGLTPQGWMRTRDQGNQVVFKQWESAASLLEKANATVISIEDVRGNESLIQEYAAKSNIFVVTEGYNGARVYWNGDVRHFSAPKVNVIDPTGAGDIFATVFFCNLQRTKDPWEAARQAVKIASASVTKAGIKGVPTIKEVRSFQIEVIEGK